MIKLTKENFKDEIESLAGTAVIDLYADWCGPCKLLAPILDSLEADYPEIKFCKINVDDEPQLARDFNVTSIPMVAVVKDNTFVDFSVGYVPREKLVRLIEENK